VNTSELILKKNKTLKAKGLGIVVKVVEYLSRESKTLSSISSTSKKKKIAIGNRK
jgi:hypothetical protein